MRLLSVTFSFFLNFSAKQRHFLTENRLPTPLDKCRNSRSSVREDYTAAVRQQVSQRLADAAQYRRACSLNLRPYPKGALWQLSDLFLYFRLFFENFSHGILIDKHLCLIFNAFYSFSMNRFREKNCFRPASFFLEFVCSLMNLDILLILLIFSGYFLDSLNGYFFFIQRLFYPAF